MQRMAAIQSEYQKWHDLKRRSSDLVEMALLADKEDDEEMLEQMGLELMEMEKYLDDMEVVLYFSGEHDDKPAIIAIKSGAGGVDAQDWAQILVRMYSRWAEEKKYNLGMLDEVPGEEAGIKSTTLRIDGRNAYGYLRTEKGIHRLIRLSPFDSNHKRHTSFALVEVLPDPGKEEEVTIDHDDLHFDYFRAGGHGGQSVQKNSTAVRVIHRPTKLVVSVQNERSQSQNRDIALQILHARLVDLDMKRRREERQRIKGEHVSAEFGRQVRSYFLHPYQLIKDHRTGHQSNDSQSVLDGDIDPFIKASLASEVEAERSTGASKK